MPGAKARHGERNWSLLWEKYGITAVLAAVWLFAALFTPNFATADNLQNVLRSASFVGVAAVGMTIAIIAGTFDLSVGFTLALAAVACVWTGPRFGLVASIAAGLAAGLLVGASSTGCWSRAHIPAFIATLGMLFVVSGFTLILTGGLAFPLQRSQLRVAGQRRCPGVPGPIPGLPDLHAAR